MCCAPLPSSQKPTAMQAVADVQETACRLLEATLLGAAEGEVVVQLVPFQDSAIAAVGLDPVAPTARQALADGHDTACKPSLAVGLVVVWIVHCGGPADAAGATTADATVAVTTESAAAMTASLFMLSSSLSRQPKWYAAPEDTEGAPRRVRSAARGLSTRECWLRRRPRAGRR